MAKSNFHQLWDAAFIFRYIRLTGWTRSDRKQYLIGNERRDVGKSKTEIWCQITRLTLAWRGRQSA